MFVISASGSSFRDGPCIGSQYDLCSVAFQAGAIYPSSIDLYNFPSRWSVVVDCNRHCFFAMYLNYFGPLAKRLSFLCPTDSAKRHRGEEGYGVREKTHLIRPWVSLLLLPARAARRSTNAWEMGPFLAAPPRRARLPILEI